MTKFETVINALFEKLKQIDGVPVYKNEPLPQIIPETGAIFIRDGTISELETLLSPPRTIYNHIAEIEIISQLVDPQERDTQIDELITTISQLFDDPTLSGLVDYCALQVPEFLLEAPEGGIPMKAAVIPIFLEYIS